MSSENTYQYPWGPADVQEIEAAAVMAAEVLNSETILQISEMAAAGTLNLTVSDKVPEGANLTVEVSADGTGRTLTFGTGLQGVAYAITASKKAVLTFKWNGIKFVNTSVILNS